MKNKFYILLSLVAFHLNMQPLSAAPTDEKGGNQSVILPVGQLDETEEMSKGYQVSYADMENHRVNQEEVDAELAKYAPFNQEGGGGGSVGANVYNDPSDWRFGLTDFDWTTVNLWASANINNDPTVLVGSECSAFCLPMINGDSQYEWKLVASVPNAIQIDKDIVVDNLNSPSLTDRFNFLKRYLKDGKLDDNSKGRLVIFHCLIPGEVTVFAQFKMINTREVIGAEKNRVTGGGASGFTFICK